MALCVEAAGTFVQLSLQANLKCEGPTVILNEQIKLLAS